MPVCTYTVHSRYINFCLQILQHLWWWSYNVWSASSEELLLLLIQVYDCTLLYLHFGCRISSLTGVVVTADRRRVFTAAGQHLEHRTVIRISIIRLCNEEDRLQHWKVIYWNLLKGRPGLITDGCLQQKLPGAEREVLHSVTRERENITHYIWQNYSNFVLTRYELYFSGFCSTFWTCTQKPSGFDTGQDTSLTTPGVACCYK